MEAVVRDRASLDGPVRGPAVVHDPGSTIFVPPTWTAAPGPSGTVLLTKTEENA